MIKFDLLLKRMWTVLAVLFCSVVSAQAAAITYQLTTHVDGRTITATANLNAGDNLNDKMPQDLWRGYTTYKYYSDAALTQEITEAPAGGTVYVDYEFDPPFLMSEEGKDPVTNYIRNYVLGGSTQRYLYYDKTDKRVYQQKGTTVTSNKKIRWAFYGDGYDFNVKLDDSSINNPWLIWGGSNDRLQLGAKPSVGWQLYANNAKTNSRPGGTVCIGRPDNGDLMYMPDLGIALKTQGINTGIHHFDSHHTLASNWPDSNDDSDASMSRNELWLYAFFASPTALVPATPDIWHVTYKIQKADGTWYDDIVVQKRSDNLTPTWPVAGFEPVEGYEYDYFYTDATFTEKFQGAMPNDCNTTLYIKETAPVEPVIYYVTYKIQKADGTWYDDIIEEKNDNNLTPTWPVTGFSPVEGYEYDYFYTDASFTEKLEDAMPADCNSTLFIKETEPAPEPINYISEPWKTLVLPFGIAEDDLPVYFGEDFEGVPAVDVLELQGIENGVLTSNAAGDFYRCNLIFKPVTAIEAYKPYLFRVNRVDEKIITEMYTAGGQQPCDVTTVNDPANPGISVSMEGTLEPNGSYMNASDGLHFYFGYDENAKAYNFYRVSAYIPKNRCWFYVNDNRPSGAKLNVTFDFNVITGIDKTVVSSKVADGKIYNINGQQVQNTLQKGIYIVNGKKVIMK